MALATPNKTTFKSSGLNALVSVSDTQVTAVAADTTSFFRNLQIINGGAIAQFSLDNGTTWHVIPANSTLNFVDLFLTGVPVLVRRVPAGTNISAMYVYTW